MKETYPRFVEVRSTLVYPFVSDLGEFIERAFSAPGGKIKKLKNKKTKEDRIKTSMRKLLAIS